jgi:hypothetical protein
MCVSRWVAEPITLFFRTFFLIDVAVYFLDPHLVQYMPLGGGGLIPAMTDPPFHRFQSDPLPKPMKRQI